jgi:hypothetical protein
MGSWVVAQPFGRRTWAATVPPALTSALGRRSEGRYEVSGQEDLPWILRTSRRIREQVHRTPYLTLPSKVTPGYGGNGVKLHQYRVK